MEFIKFCQLAKPLIKSNTRDCRLPPAELPSNVCILLSRLIKENFQNTQEYWKALKGHIWVSKDEVIAAPSDVVQYNREALPLGTSYRHIFPPTRVCLTPGCPNFRTPNESNIMTLSDPSTYTGTLFTLREGALPVFTTSLYCRGCYKRYYHNYSVHKQSSSRQYYVGIPECIQASMHYFIDTPLLEFFGAGSTFGWLSSMNASRIYNESIGDLNSHILNNRPAYIQQLCSSDLDKKQPQQWAHSLRLDEEFLLNGFFLYSLLLDKSEQLGTLSLVHDEQSQRLRLRDALLERNKRMEGPGQEAYFHACDLCFFVFEDDDGGIYKVRAVVCDGVSMGFPCCVVHDCTEPLANPRDRFCHTHRGLADECAVIGCHQLHTPGFRTCEDASHRALEHAYFEKGKSLLQLRKRLKNVHANQQGHQLEDIEDLDEIIANTCGVVAACAPLYGSEAVSGVNEFAKATYPTPESTPEFFIFDNNCRLDLHQRATGDHHFKDTAKPVDVFHFKSKHKLTDTHCQLHCNPAAFPELIKDGRWRFNSSICEQVNAWLGKYHPILRDMESVRFSFYLDEMIKRRNRYIIKELARQGHNPWTIPPHAVFPDLFK
ncbi:hypothetical protein BDN70DRAFT_810293 [Pholiota conissans]|uniref:CxC5 like cysteine cluster associated with KDZ domain-containing protein n=1 Tax=Pholiota conissans TaxID=109636 RepID=A0A9P6CYT7_9AGAR|nr:hypothetical protein BDN70DRAFT_810293 [Pholiota conissans]